MAEAQPKPPKHQCDGNCLPNCKHGLQRDTRRDSKRKPFGLKTTSQYRDSRGNLGKAHSWTSWYRTEKQRDEAYRTETNKGNHGWLTITEIRTFEKLER